MQTLRGETWKKRFTTCQEREFIKTILELLDEVSDEATISGGVLGPEIVQRIDDLLADVEFLGIRDINKERREIYVG